MPSPATDDFDDYSEELYDAELPEDDEIDDDDALRGNKPQSKGSLGDRDDGSDNDNSGSKETNHENDPQGRSAQLRPPRPTRSTSVGRKPKVQGGGSMHRRRATRRVTPSDKKRSASGGSPPITVRDIMGSEKKATAVGITHSGHTRPTAPATPVKGSKTGAEEKRNMIRSRWKEKQSRQCDVKNSLAQFLSSESQSDDSDQEFLIDPEDEEIISDVDDGDKYRHDSENAQDVDPDEVSDDAKSVKSSKSQRRRRGSTRKPEDQDGEGSNHSRSRRTSRRRVKKPTGGSDDKSVGDAQSRKTRHSPRPGGEDRDTTRHRTKDDGRSGEGDGSRRLRDVDDGHKKSRSSSSRRKPSEGDGAKSRSTRRKGHADDDERSVGSRKSVGGRRRRQQPSQRTKPTSSSDSPQAPRLKSRHNGHDEKGSVSPVSSKPSSSSSVTEGRSKSHLLAKHIESVTKPRTLQDLEERSEESSRFSANYEQPTSLLQFDPTNANNITFVRQDKASMTSERIRNADGTESEFHISRLAGLPTFESSNPDFDSTNWDNSASQLGHQSSRSLGSVGYESEDHAAKAHKSMTNLGYTPRRKDAAQEVNQSGRNGRGVGRDTTAGRSRGVASSKSFQDSMKGLFGVWNKKGECESGDDDDDQQRGNRFFRKREDIAHQALDDDGSD